MTVAGDWGLLLDATNSKTNTTVNPMKVPHSKMAQKHSQNTRQAGRAAKRGALNWLDAPLSHAQTFAPLQFKIG